MKREVRLLKGTAVASLALSVEHFNRPWDLGRGDALLIPQFTPSRCFQAAILDRGGKIRQRHEKNSIGLDACVRRALSIPKRAVLFGRAGAGAPRDQRPESVFLRGCLTWL